MVMSRDSGFKFQKFLILLNSVLNFRKGYQFGGNWLKNKNVTGKKPIGEQKAPLPPSAYRVNGFLNTR